MVSMKSAPKEKPEQKGRLKTQVVYALQCGILQALILLEPDIMAHIVSHPQP